MTASSTDACQFLHVGEDSPPPLYSISPGVPKLNPSSDFPDNENSFEPGGYRRGHSCSKVPHGSPNSSQGLSRSKRSTAVDSSYNTSGDGTFSLNKLGHSLDRFPSLSSGQDSIVSITG